MKTKVHLIKVVLNILWFQIITHFEDEELEEIKERIIICDDDTEFKLEEIVTGNEVSLTLMIKFTISKFQKYYPTLTTLLKLSNLKQL